MGHESVVYGCILGSRWKHPNINRLQKLNKQILKKLPITDDWPFLTKDMFSIPSDHFAKHKSQVIHFGATYKEVEWTWEIWLEKFENLLSKLYWNYVYLHLQTTFTVGTYEYRYKAIDWSEQFIGKEPPQPATVWELTGGPRNFEWREPPNKYGDENSVWIYENGLWRVKSEPE